MDKDKQEANSKIQNEIVIYGIVVHLLVLVAVSDLYFSSSTDTSIKSIEPPSADKPPAKRLVLFLVDGLGYEAIFGSNPYGSLFLSNVGRRQGSYGIAHSRFPTLGRSGNLAILTGTYEDPIAAIAKDWTSRPIHIDSIVTQSKHTWLFGSRHIVRQLNPENLDHVHDITCPQTHEEPLDPKHKRTVVTDIKSFLDKNKYRTSLKGSVFNEKGTIFLVYLPQRDKKNSANDEIRSLNNDIEGISKLIAQTFNDGSTAFVVASAYGKTKWGAHGGDSPHETETLFVAWGAGVRRNVGKIDIDQIDVAPLLACLIGVSIPVNSLGVVPLDYLDLPKEHFVSEQATNALQLASVFENKRNHIKAHSLYFDQYKNLTSESLSDRFAHLKYLHFQGKHTKLIKDCEELISELLQGISYYDKYYNSCLICCVLFGYFVWIIYVACRTYIDTTVVHDCQNRPLGLLVLIPIYFGHIQYWPLLYYIYSIFPFLMFYATFPYIKCLLVQCRVSEKPFLNHYFALIQIIVLVIFYRIVASLSMLLIGALILISGSFGEDLSKKAKVIWSASSAVLAVCSALPRLELTVFSVPLLVYGFSVWIYLASILPTKVDFGKNVRLFGLQKMCFILAGLYRLLICFGSFRSHVIAWLVCILPVMMIPFTTNSISARLTSLIFGSLPFYLMASSSDELLFLVVYVASLLQWLIIEVLGSASDLEDLSAQSVDDHKELDEDDKNLPRRVFMMVTFLFVGFFGAGNTFNVNSYNPVWTQPFLHTGVCPILDAILIILKLSLPICFCVFTFRTISVGAKQNFFKLIGVLIVVFQIFLFEILLVFVFYKDEWIEISLVPLIGITGLTIVILVSYKMTNGLTILSFLPCTQNSWFFNKLVS